MHWKPDRTLSISLSKQIVQWITENIQNGEWPSGTKLPTQRQLAVMLGVNRSTIQEAMDELKADGIISSKIGSSTYVSNASWNMLVKQKQPNWQKYIEASIHKPNYQTIQVINACEQDDSIIRLSTGELAPSLLPTAKIQSSLQQLQLDGRAIGYSSPQGSLHLREALCQYLKKRRIIASPDNICIVSGGLQALQLIAVGLLETGSIVFQDPFSYLNSIHPFQSFGMDLQSIELSNRNTTALEKRRGRRQSIYYAIPTLHNPTGAIWSMEEKQSFYDMCKTLHLPIIEDDVYFELAFEELTPPLKAIDTAGHVLYLGSMSKTLSPGLRIGWVVAPSPVIKRLADIKMQMDYGSSAFSQEIVTHWLTTGLYEQHIQELKVELRRRAVLMEGLLKQYFTDIASWQSPKGGFYIWIRFHQPIVTTDFFFQLLKQKVLINPGYIYEPKDTHHIRLSYAYASDSELQSGLHILYEEAMGKMREC
ncbi:PLP-dependent aminotransferase family protein [Lysinibacillus sp. KU-BSD001]|uniref:aminotransferase-like domain-containing protein n=1 Tax=Lysinibacillus sp. KU-BSD001 TaxID=3141328 RepID=UPI0036EB6AB0